jgi:hypothetical protein
MGRSSTNAGWLLREGTPPTFKAALTIGPLPHAQPIASRRTGAGSWSAPRSACRLMPASAHRAVVTASAAGCGLFARPTASTPSAASTKYDSNTYLHIMLHRLVLHFAAEKLSAYSISAGVMHASRHCIFASLYDPSFKIRITYIRIEF